MHQNYTRAICDGCKTPSPAVCRSFAILDAKLVETEGWEVVVDKVGNGEVCGYTHYCPECKKTRT